MTAGQVRAVSLPMLGRAAWAGAQTLYWGGGASDIAGPQALPTEPGDLAGTWNTTLRNRATDSAGTTCQPWSNSGTNRTALIGHGLATDTADATIALGDSVALNTLDIRDAKGSANKKVRFATFPDSPVTITLNGAAPTVDLRGGINREAVFPAAVSWSGTSGLRFRTTGTDQGWLTLHGDASALTGTLEGLGGLYSRVNLAAGSKLGTDLARFTAGRLILQTADGAANSAFPDNLSFVSMGNRAFLELQACAGATPGTETIGRIVLDGGFVTLDASNRSGGSGANGRFILSHATAGIDRGRHGKGMFALVTQPDDSLRTDIEVANGLDAGIIPWAMTSYGRLVELDDGKVLRVRLNTDAPVDVTTWAAGSDYRLAAAPAGTLAGIALNSLTAYFAGISPTLAIEDGATLTLTRGLLGLQRTGTVVTWTITGGKITTPAVNMHVNQGTGASKIVFDTQLDGGFDLVLSGWGSAVEMKGPAANTYSGTTYTSGTLTLRKPTASAPAIPGDLVVLHGRVEFCSSGTQTQIARCADVTIEAAGELVGGGNGGTQDFGGIVTINGGTWLGNYSISHHAFDGPGFGLRFNGGRFGVNTMTGSGNYYLLTDLSYAGDSTRQAVFENPSTAQVLRLTEAGKGAAVRIFAITNSAVLPAATPEVAVYMALAEAGTAEKAGLTKTGSGTLALRGMAYNLSGEVTVEDGTLVAAGGWNAVSRAGTTVKGSSVVTGLGATSDLVPGQLVTGTGIPATTTILGVDSASQITLSQNATADGTTTLTFAGRGALARRQVMAGTRTGDSPVITGLASTADLVLRQEVSGTGIPGGTWIVSVDSPSQVTLSASAYNSGTADITFKAGSATGTGPVTVAGNGTLAGEAVCGPITVGAGGTLDPGVVPAAAGTFTAAAGVTFADGATWHVDIADGESADTLVCHGDLVLAGAVAPAAVDGHAIPSVGEWIIAICTGTISGSLAAPAGYAVKVDAVAGRVLLSRGLPGTVVLIR